MSIKLHILLNFRENVSWKSSGNHRPICWSVRHPKFTGDIVQQRVDQNVLTFGQPVRSKSDECDAEWVGTNASVWTKAQRILYMEVFVCGKRMTAQMFLSRLFATNTYSLIKVMGFCIFRIVQGSTQHAFLQAARCIRMNTYQDRSQPLHNPFSPTLLLIVAKMSLPEHSGPYWLTVWRSG